ncbi:MAG TPA: PEP/pyruvate-binding domain-containing protein, partial [Gemmatimonadaceae bacterium]|nr:PEP/pyruvate-binding domain-containing protein [Gemmatimonadaceae bacterium]
AYHALVGATDGAVAVRSSATAEDAASASFAGMFESYLDVRGVDSVIDRVRDCWASAFGARVLFYRVRQSLPPEMSVAVVVQRMISSTVSGVMFTADPATRDLTSIVIEASTGLGEAIVQGRVVPDRYVVDKATRTVRTAVPADPARPVLSQVEIDTLATLGARAEKHFGAPQDMEFAIDSSGIFLTQTRPITTLGVTATTQAAVASTRPAPLLVRGLGASPGSASGIVRVIARPGAILHPGEVLVAHFTSPDWVPQMRRAAAIVTESGGMTSHAAIVSRELGVPCVVGATNAMALLKDGAEVTVNGSTGEVFAGAAAGPTPAPESAPTTAVRTAPVTATRIYVNLDDPSQAEKVASRDVDGVGLLRAEFM